MVYDIRENRWYNCKEYIETPGKGNRSYKLPPTPLNGIFDNHSDVLVAFHWRISVISGEPHQPNNSNRALNNTIKLASIHLLNHHPTMRHPAAARIKPAKSCRRRCPTSTIQNNGRRRLLRRNESRHRNHLRCRGPSPCQLPRRLLLRRDIDRCNRFVRKLLLVLLNIKCVLFID